jgi:hypothetical protein
MHVPSAVHVQLPDALANLPLLSACRAASVVSMHAAGHTMTLVYYTTMVSSSSSCAFRTHIMGWHTIVLNHVYHSCPLEYQCTHILHRLHVFSMQVMTCPA